MAEQNRYTFKELVDIIKRIRRDCPWDSVQTHESLKECLVNETEEVLEGIDLFRETGDSDNFCEELGDLLMLVILQSEIAREEGAFTVDDVISGVADKMKFRHPKIFFPEDKEACSLSWDELKKREKKRRKRL